MGQAAPQQDVLEPPVTVVVESGKSWAEFAGDVLDAALDGRVSSVVVVVLVAVVLLQARMLWRRRK